MFRRQEKPLWYLIEGYQDRLPEILSSGIVCTVASIHSPKNVTGISFPVEFFDRVNEIIGNPNLINEVKTDTRGLSLLEPPQVVRIDPDNMQQWDSMVPVFADYATRWGKNILVINPHGRGWSPNRIEENCRYVAFWSSVNTNQDFEKSEVIGHELISGQRSFIEPERDTPPEDLFIDEEDEVPFAQVRGNVLYVLFDLPHRGNEVEPILNEIMRLWEDHQCMRSPVFAENIIRRQTEIQDTLANKYVTLCADRYQMEISDLNDEIEANNKRLVELRKETIECLRENEKLSRVLSVLLENGANDRETLLADFQLIIDNPKIKKVTIQGETILVQTTNLVTRKLKDGTVRDLGAYTIKVTLSGNIVTLNKTRQVSGRHHPHSNSSGSLCFGNYEQIFAQLISRYRFEQLFVSIINFLEQPNEDDLAGRSVYNWPVYEREEVQ